MATVQTLQVNGVRRVLDADAERSLLSVLRDDLDLTGSKYGCGERRCGACTVLLDGRPVRSCSTPVSAAEGKPIQTIEGLAKDGKLHPVQKAFLKTDALQCGYCTSGMIMTATALLSRNPKPKEADVRVALAGNLCRCGSHVRVIAAVLRAAKEA